MIKSDYHVHTNFSVDAKTSMQDMVEHAITIGLEEIVFTDHQDYLYNGDDSPYAIDYVEYMYEFNKLKEKYYSKIKMVLGVEIGLNPKINNKISKFTNSLPFEFIIGSSHDVRGITLEPQNLPIEKDNKIFYTEYFLEVLENIRVMDCFCVYGHLDYIARYAYSDDKSLYYRDYADLIDEILKNLIFRGKGIEINTSGYRYNLNQLHPQLDILKRYKELGGEIVTIGSDAHHFKYLAEHFDMAESYLKEAGFNAYCIFRELKPVFVKI